MPFFFSLSGRMAFFILWEIAVIWWMPKRRLLSLRLCTGGWKLIIYSIKSEVKFRNGIKNSDFKFNLTKRRENSIT